MKQRGFHRTTSGSSALMVSRIKSKRFAASQQDRCRLYMRAPSPRFLNLGRLVSRPPAVARPQYTSRANGLHAHRADPNRVGVCVDIRNACNSIHRSAVITAIRTHFPSVVPWVDLCYRYDSTLFTGARASRPRPSPAQRRCSRGPLLFSSHSLWVLFSSHSPFTRLSWRPTASPTAGIDL